MERYLFQVSSREVNEARPGEASPSVGAESSFAEAISSAFEEQGFVIRAVSINERRRTADVIADVVVHPVALEPGFTVEWPVTPLNTHGPSVLVVNMAAPLRGIRCFNAKCQVELGENSDHIPNCPYDGF